MNHFIPLCIIFILVGNSLQIPKYENCDSQVLSGESVKDCLYVKCKGRNHVDISTCEEKHCKKRIGYHNGDPTQEYPACCSYPICEE